MASVASDLRLPFQLQSTASWPVLISHPAHGRRLSWPEWLVMFQDNIPANGNRSRMKMNTGRWEVAVMFGWKVALAMRHRHINLLA